MDNFSIVLKGVVKNFKTPESGEVQDTWDASWDSAIRIGTHH